MTRPDVHVRFARQRAYHASLRIDAELYAMYGATLFLSARLREIAADVRAAGAPR